MFWVWDELSTQERQLLVKDVEVIIDKISLPKHNILDPLFIEFWFLSFVFFLFSRDFSAKVSIWYGDYVFTAAGGSDRTIPERLCFHGRGWDDRG